MTSRVISKYHTLLPGKPEVPGLRTNGSVMSDDGDNVVWYIDANGNEYEFHVKPATWYRLKY